MALHLFLHIVLLERGCVCTVCGCFPATVLELSSWPMSPALGNQLYTAIPEPSALSKESLDFLLCKWGKWALTLPHLICLLPNSVSNLSAFILRVTFIYYDVTFKIARALPRC